MKTENIPGKPGCYLFEDGGGNIIYVGKAKDLKKRVSSYLSRKGLDQKTLAMLEKAVSVDTIVTRNEKEALILESNLIKIHQPKYNINLRDSKRYAYVMLTKEESPRIVVARKRTEDGDYFGPFPSAENRDEVLRFASNLFKLRTCRRLPLRVCLRYHMGTCTAPCEGKASNEEYALQVKDAVKFLSGKNADLIADLKVRMAKHARHLQFEDAKALRDRITAIEYLNEKQGMETQRTYDQDIINYIVDGPTVHLAVFNAKNGVLSSKDDFDFDYADGFLEELLLQYYSEQPVPKEIILPERISEPMESYLSDKRGGKVMVTVPSKGEKKDLLELVERNLEKNFLEGELEMQNLAERIGLEKTPVVIECFDISHLAGTNPVGSMVRFAGGKPDKGGYRQFRIKTIEGIDDYAMIGEIVRRRYERLLAEKKEMPDLIVIDGGAGQLASALTQLRMLNLTIPTIALAKENEEIYLPGEEKPIRLDRKSRALHLLQKVRDEAHRFAVKYHKLLRTKRVLNKK